MLEVRAMGHRVMRTALLMGDFLQAIYSLAAACHRLVDNRCSAVRRRRISALAIHRLPAHINGTGYLEQLDEFKGLRARLRGLPLLGGNEDILLQQQQGRDVIVQQQVALNRNTRAPELEGTAHC